MNEIRPVNNILIVGGGTAGWMAATYLASQLRATGGRVTLVESPNVPTIGVGEATVPPLVGYLRILGISESEFMRRSSATYKLGIKFLNWHSGNDAYWHPFGPVGGTIDGMHLFHFWLKHRRLGGASEPYTAYSAQTLIAEEARAPRAPDKSSPIYDRGQYAYHLDAGAFAEFLKHEALQRGARHLADEVTRVDVDERGLIMQIITRDHGALSADLYIDCSGFKALLSENALGDRYHDWSDTLLCDRALAAPLPHDGTMLPYTRSTAVSAGWIWQIPLSSRMGNGYVYCSRFVSDDAAGAELARFLGADPKTLQPRPIHMRVGRRDRFWRGNCIAMGLASGFVEPLESTGIFIIQRGLALLLSYFPDTSFDPCLAERYNERMATTYDEIRDFIILHYVLSQRTDTAFWKTYRELAIPDSLSERLDMYRSTGLIEVGEHAMFPPDSWYCILSGLQHLPRTYHSGAELSDFSKVRHIMAAIREGNVRMAQSLPAHAELIRMLNGGHGIAQLAQTQLDPRAEHR